GPDWTPGSVPKRSGSGFTILEEPDLRSSSRFGKSLEKTGPNRTAASLPLLQINQLLILANFATLRLKGFKCINASLQIAQQWHEGQGAWFARRVRALARHYQIFEQLPIEKRGGTNARSWLLNELVRNRTQDWLTAQPTGKVTPRALQHALNSI